VLLSLYTYLNQDSVNPVYFLAWIPESLLHERGEDEWEKYTKVEEKFDLTEKANEDEGKRNVFVLPIPKSIIYDQQILFLSISQQLAQSPTLSPCPSIQSIV
jgi:TBC1 domain family member 15